METGNKITSSIPLKKTTTVAEKLHLTLLIGEYETAYSILNKSNTTYTEISINNNSILPQILETLITYNFDSVAIISENNKATLIPEALFVKKNERNYLALNIDIPNQLSVESKLIPNIQSYLIFTINSNQKEITAQYPTAKIFHLQQILIEKNTVDSKKIKQELVHLYLSKKIFWITIAKKGQLLFCNSFAFSKSDDVVYYTLFTLEQLKLEPLSIVLKIWGENKLVSPTITVLNQYLKNVNKGELPSEFQYTEGIKETENHTYLPLFTQYLCE